MYFPNVTKLGTLLAHHFSHVTKLGTLLAHLASRAKSKPRKFFGGSAFFIFLLFLEKPTPQKNFGVGT